MIVSADDLAEWPTERRESFTFLVASNAMILPCVYCRESFRVFVRAIDLRKWIQGPLLLQPVTRSSVNEYLHTLHNMVNQKLNKPWHTDVKLGVYQNLLSNETLLMRTLFDWLYILFLNYPDLKRPQAPDDECCAKACKAMNRGIAKEPIAAADKEQEHCRRDSVSSVSHSFTSCPTSSLSAALEHVKRLVSKKSFLSSANAQGVTVGSYVNEKVFQPTYDAMLSPATKAQLDSYTFLKICWYVVHIHNLTKLLLQTDVNAQNTIGLRSPEAVRAVMQIRQTFLKPLHAEGKQGARKRCRCADDGFSACAREQLGAWSSTGEAVRQLHFAQTVWSPLSETLDETQTRIAHYRATGK